MLAGVSGTILQWYDFAIFGYFAPIIAANYFPNHSPVAAMLHVFAMFAVGYLLSPIGSLVFGYIGDHYGRKRALTISVLIMAIATALIAILPGYKTIGLMAPIGMCLLRIIQGLVASSEFSGSAIFLVEHAPTKSRAFYGSLTSSAYSVGVVIAGLVATLLTASYMPAWGWRLGFAIALIGGGVIFYLRHYVPETPAWKHIGSNKPRLPLLLAIKTVPYAFVGVIGLAWLEGVMTFGTYVFVGSYVHHYFHIALSTVTLMTTMAIAVDAILEPFMAILADRVGYLRIAMLGIGLMILLSVPIFHLLASGNLIKIGLGMVSMSCLIATAFAPLNAYMVQLFPEECRYSGFGVSFHIGISVFGGTAPLVLMFLVEKTGNFTAPAYYYMMSAVVGLSALVLCEFGRYKNSFHTK